MLTLVHKTYGNSSNIVLHAMIFLSIFARVRFVCEFETDCECMRVYFARV